MQSLFRRPSGIYVLRLSVPGRLRPILGQREVIASTGTRELSVAKLVASAQAAQWRERFFETGRLLASASTTKMNHEEILQIAHGHPKLLLGGHLPLPQAAAASGLAVTDLLRQAAAGRLSLFLRDPRTKGYLVPVSALERVDDELGSSGGLIIPDRKYKPVGSIDIVADGILRIPLIDTPGVVAELLAGAETVALFAFELPDRQGWYFVPDVLVKFNQAQIEVASLEVEFARKAAAAHIDPERLQHAKDGLKAAVAAEALPAHKGRQDEPLSSALDAYVEHHVSRSNQSAGETRRIRDGCALLIELEGDLLLGAVDTARLRHFRQSQLSRVPANENKIRLMHKTKSVRESIDKTDGTDWPKMSVGERDKRMRWICAWFRWLQAEAWINSNPAAPLEGQSVLSRREAKQTRIKGRRDQARDMFTTADLALIFGTEWFSSGRGTLTKEGTYREC